jgi:hypothetical protein
MTAPRTNPGVTDQSTGAGDPSVAFSLLLPGSLCFSTFLPLLRKRSHPPCLVSQLVKPRSIHTELEPKSLIGRPSHAAHNSPVQ